MTNIPIARPLFGAEEVQAVKDVLESGWVVQGPRAAEFEKRFAAYTGAQHALACSNGTTALHLANAALRLDEGDEVIVPAFTWVATPNSVVYCNATPVFCDIDLATYNIDPKQIESKITPKTKGIIAVHLFGLCAEMEPILDLAKRHDLWIVEDAACAFGATWRGQHAGNIGDLGTFSFHPRKSITTGEGGMVTTAREDLAQAVRSFRDHGAAPRKGEPPFLLPDYDEIGFNYRLTDIQAAIGLAQLARADHILAERRRRAAIYDEALREFAWLKTPYTPPDMRHGYQAYVCLFDGNEEQRNELMAKLDARGIITRQGTHAPVLRAAYRTRFGIDPNAFTNSIKAETRTLALPLYPQMTDDDQQRVLDALRESAP